MKYWIVLAFLISAPLGKLIPVPGTPHSFRFFYLLMAASLPLLALGLISRRLVLFALSQLPFLLYLLASAIQTFTPGSVEGAEGNPVFRALLLAVELAFTALIASHCQREPLHVRAQLAVIPLLSYLVSLAFGYVFFVGFYTGALSTAILEPFYVILDFGYGLLRFSPGSYANEYGIVSSFFASLTLILILRWEQVCLALGWAPRWLAWFRRILIATWPLMIIALFLSTTRAAYIAFAVSLVAIGISLPTLRARTLFFVTMGAAAAMALAIAQQYFDVLGVFRVAYTAFFDKNASAYTRFSDWQRAYAAFALSPWTGSGFGTTEFIHNVYLQVLFGAGLIGGLLFGFFFVALRSARQSVEALPRNTDGRRQAASLGLLRTMMMLAVFHTLWFGCSNHNFNHFLTWFTVLLVLMTPRRTVSSVASETVPHSFSA